MEAGKIVHLAIEINERGPHYAPFCRLPYIGGFEDWQEVIRLGVRMDWKTPTGWMATYLQRYQGQDFNDNMCAGVSDAYIRASRLNAVFRSYMYQDASQERGSWISARVIIEVTHNHLASELSLLERDAVIMRREPRRLPLGQIEARLVQLGHRVRKHAHKRML